MSGAAVTARDAAPSRPLPNGRHRAAPPHLGFRGDIQGLRAVAVLLVVANHIWGRPVGGFVGVDVFFVISGYLITGVLLRQVDRQGRFSFLAFYQARIRRIIPAALVVLASCLVAAELVFSASRLAQTKSDLWWALAFAANVHFQRIGTDYFHAGQPPSLVQHFWSLAVEEQFYVVWPVVILVVLTLSRRVLPQRSARLTALLSLIAAASLASFLLALHQSSGDPTTAYFSTLDRAWELGVGAALAVVLSLRPAIGARLRSVAGPALLLSVALIVVAGFVVTSNSGFPAPWAALPVLATASAILFGGFRPGTAWTAVLTNPVSQYVGLVSYSLYLWHWPTLLICQTLLPTRPAVFYPMVLSATVALTVLSYHLVEAPCRATLFRPAADRRSIGSGHGRKLLAGVLAAGVAVGCFVFRPIAQPPHLRTDRPTAAGGSSRTPQNRAQNRALHRAQAIDAALTATSFPAHFSPPLSALNTNSEQADWAGCNNDGAVQASCVFAPASGSSASKRVVVLGDSIALAMMPAIKSALLSRGWTIYGLARQQCPEAYVKVTDMTSADSQACDTVHRAYRSLIATIKPSLVVMTSVESNFGILRDRATGTAAVKEYRRGLIKTLKLVRAPGRKVVVLSPPPAIGMDQVLATCDNGVNRPPDCISKVFPSWQLLDTTERSATRATHTDYVDTHLWFCSADLYCPSFVGTTPVRYDNVHPTKAYAQGLGPEVRQALLGSAR